MHMICLFKPIPATEERTKFLYMSCRKKLPHPPAFGAPSDGARGHMPLPLPAATDNCFSVKLNACLMQTVRVNYLEI